MAVEPDRVVHHRRIDHNAHEQSVGRDAEAPPDPADRPVGRVVRRAHELDLVLERAVLPCAVVTRDRLWLGDFGDRAVERDAHIAVPGAMAVQDDRAILDAHRELRGHGGAQLLEGAALGAVLHEDPLAVQRAQIVGRRRRRARVLRPRRARGQRRQSRAEGCEERERCNEPGVQAHGGVSCRISSRANGAPALRRTRAARGRLPRGIIHPSIDAHGSCLDA